MVLSPNVIVKVRKVQTSMIYLVNISETVHAMTNVCETHIYEVIDDISVYLMIFAILWPF